jgi:hypothetical protein
MARKKRTSKTITGWAAARGARGVIRQAESDVERGLEDTDRRARPALRKKRAPSR